MSYRLFLIALITFAGLHPASAAKIAFLTHSMEGKTFQDSKGELRGKKHSGRRAFQLELVREMMTKLSFSPKTFRVLPFKRGLTMIKNDQNSYAFFNIAKSLDRMEHMHFVGPLTQSVTYLYELKADPSDIQTLGQAKNLPVCVFLGGISDTIVTEMGFTNIIRTKDENCFKMLVRKRVRLVSIENLDLLETLKKTEINPNLIQSTSVHLYKAEDSLSFSKRVPDDEVQRWQSALDDIKLSGRYDELLKEYLHPK